ncbi:Flap-structured DNA-binding and RNA-binding protein [Coemansia sp. RSA 1200]|nr:Flap-structured DNA-binding and RNA-binding protein [Coemansia sp. RSA 1200]
MSSNAPSSVATSSANSSMDQASRTSTASDHYYQQQQQGFNPAPPVAPFAAGGGGGKSARPASEIFFANAQHPLPEAKHIDRWFESLSQFEDMLEDMAKVSLDPVFKDELNAIDQWFSVLSEPERTAALYSLMQHCSDLQVRFFITILQQMLRIDQDPEAAAEAIESSAGQNIERHSIAVQGGYAKTQTQQPHLHQHAAMRVSYDGVPGYVGGSGLRSGSAGSGNGGSGPVGASMLSAGSSGMQRTAGWASNSHTNLSSDNILTASAGKLVGHQQQRPRSSNHDADISSDWRAARAGAGGSAVGSPTADQFPHHQQQVAVGAVGSSRRQSNNVIAQQSSMTPRVSIDMEPKDFRWSSLTDSLEPVGNMGSEHGSAALTHMLEANMNRTSGIAARRSVSNRLSIAVKSPRDTLQAQQHQQHIAASLAQLTMGGAAGPNTASSPLGATFAQHQHQQQQQGQNRGMYAPNAAPGGRMHSSSNGSAGSAIASGPSTPTRTGFPRSTPHGSAGAAGHPSNNNNSPNHLQLQGAQHSTGAMLHQQQQLPQQQQQQQQQQLEKVDLELVKDIPAWLRSLRLHKYTDCFADMDWSDVVSLSDEQLQAKGVAALGARRKMLKVFEAVQAETRHEPV